MDDDRAPLFPLLTTSSPTMIDGVLQNHQICRLGLSNDAQTLSATLGGARGGRRLRTEFGKWTLRKGYDYRLKSTADGQTSGGGQGSSRRPHLCGSQAKACGWCLVRVGLSYLGSGSAPNTMRPPITASVGIVGRWFDVIRASSRVGRERARHFLLRIVR